MLYHLTEDSIFLETLDTIFNWACRFVVIYASNVDAAWPDPHVRHRCFTDHVASAYPGWRLLAHLPNPYPFDQERPNDTSFADFFIYGKRNEACVIPIPYA